MESNAVYSLWMMWGELVGLGLVSVASVAGVATIMLTFPTVFTVLKGLGGAYLIYLGLQMWRHRIIRTEDPSYFCFVPVLSH